MQGWLKGEKLKYKGTRGYSEIILKNVSKEKRSISNYNAKERTLMELEKWKRNREFRGLLKVDEPKVMLEQVPHWLFQISSLKDEIMKNREKRTMFLSYDGVRLDQVTKSYFESIEQTNPDSLIIQLGAFDEPLNNDK